MLRPTRPKTTEGTPARFAMFSSRNLLTNLFSDHSVRYRADAIPSGMQIRADRPTVHIVPKMADRMPACAGFGCGYSVRRVGVSLCAPVVTTVSKSAATVATPMKTPIERKTGASVSSVFLSLSLLVNL
jgi:hypothetical protein